jgi:nicotinate-nucleotide adenylyltransferase
VEKRLGGVSRTLHTLEALRAEHPDASFRLLVGADVLPTTERWHRWDEVTKLAPPLVIGREGYPVPEGCPISIPDVSSTQVRAALEGQGELYGLLPRTVIEYIRVNGLYTSAA